MSKALRIAFDEIPTQKYINVLSWHPFHVHKSGENTPCLSEFISLMQCLHHSNNANKCNFQYKNLLKCLQAHGITQNNL